VWQGQDAQYCRDLPKHTIAQIVNVRSLAKSGRGNNAELLTVQDVRRTSYAYAGQYFSNSSCFHRRSRNYVIHYDEMSLNIRYLCILSSNVSTNINAHVTHLFEANDPKEVTFRTFAFISRSSTGTYGYWLSGPGHPVPSC
jgi:hypothetical protein